MAESIDRATNEVQSWLERNDFAGWDPFDLLNSPLLEPIGGRNRLVGILLVQLGKRSPINFRRVLRVPRVRNAKAIGLSLQAYLTLRQSTGASVYDERITRLAAWLVDNSSPGYAGSAWGYPFDWPNRSFVAARGTPSVVTTYFCAMAMLNLARQSESFGYRLAFDPLRVARSACDFVINDLKRIPDPMSPSYFSWSYTPIDNRQIHNASLFGARLLAEVSKVRAEPALSQLARDSAYYTATRQRPDGSWPYGEDRRNSWVDNFHTAYVVSSLLAIATILEDRFLFDIAMNGYAFWKSRFIKVDGLVKSSPSRTYPIDIHDVAQAIVTSLDFAPHDPDALTTAQRIATWSLGHMAGPGGQFAYRRHRLFTVAIPYTRWNQAWMFYALSALRAQVNVPRPPARPRA